jgi:hypothetical protein
MRKLFGVALAVGALGVAGCGDTGGTTTVIKETPARTVERTTTVEVPARDTSSSPTPTPTPPPSPTPSEPPNVVGLPLPEAQRMLKEAGYRTVAKNTDTTFGIIVPDNYTICTQGKPRGEIVVVLAQKYGC